MSSFPTASRLRTQFVAGENEDGAGNTSREMEKMGSQNTLNPVNSPLTSACKGTAVAEALRENLRNDPLIRPLRLAVMGHSGLRDSPAKPNNSAFQILVKHEDPDRFYEPVLYIGNKESVMTAISRVHPFRNVRAIKKRSIPRTSRPPDLIWHLSHENIADAVEAFYHGGCVFTIYERLELSFQSLGAVPVAVEEFHAASIASQVLRGLCCIEEAFQRRRGCLTAGRILFASNGSVKIGNVADALQSDEPRNVDADTKVLGQLLENLRDQWSLQARAFFDAARQSSCEELLKCHFVKNSPGPSCLRRYVSIATVAVNKQWGLPIKISSGG